MDVERFVEDLRDAAATRDRHERHASVLRLRDGIRLTCVAAAVRLLVEDAEPTVRQTAAEVLGAEVGDGLVGERLSDIALIATDELDCLVAVAIELGRSRSVDAIPTLGVLAAHDASDVRAAAAAGLAELVELDPRAAAPLRYLAGDDDAQTRHTARRALSAPTAV